MATTAQSISVYPLAKMDDDFQSVDKSEHSSIQASVNLWTMPTLAGLGVSPGGLCAECRTVLGKAQAPRVEASLGVYCPDFIQ